MESGRDHAVEHAGEIDQGGGVAAALSGDLLQLSRHLLDDF